MDSGASGYTYFVSYDRNGATGGVAPKDGTPYHAGDLVTVKDNAGNLVRNGDTFANWNTAADGTRDGYGGAGPEDFPMPSNDVTLYAQWFTTAGLTPDNQGNPGRTAHYQFAYDSSLQKTPANPLGIEPDRTNALIEACEGDFVMMQIWFGGIELGAPIIVPVNVQVANLPGGAKWDPETSYCTLKPEDGDFQNVTYLRYLLVMEVTEMFMLAQGQGWHPPREGANNEGSAGEGLSRFLAAQFLLETGSSLDFVTDYAVAGYWLNSALDPPVDTYDYDYGPRGNYVDMTLLWDNEPDPATGCAVLFLYYLLDELGFSVPDIVTAGDSTLAGVYAKLTGDPDSPFAAFRALLDRAFPPNTLATIPGLNPDDPWPLDYRPPRPLVMARTGRDGLTSIASSVSVNASGSVAFAGTDATGQGLFVADGMFSGDGQSPPRNINPDITSDHYHIFSEFVQINNAGDVLAVHEVPGTPMMTYLQAWDSQIKDAYQAVAHGGEEKGIFDAVMSPASSSRSTSVANGGVVVFPALIKGASCLATPLSTQATSPLVTGIVRPRISDGGRIVVRSGWQANSPILIYNDLAKDPVDITAMSGSNPVFSAAGRSPGISADGQIVAFYGELTPAGAGQLGLPAGPGIFAAILIGSQWTIHRVAGTGGDDPAALVPDAPVGVNSVRMFTYLGVDADGNQGVYMTRLSFFSVDPARPVFWPVAAPARLAAVGAPLPLADGSSLDVLQNVNIYDPLNEPGDVTFWVQTVSGLQAVVLLPRGSGGDYLDSKHATYINAYAAGSMSPPYSRGLPMALSDGQRGGDACGAAALTMLMNAMQYATSLLPGFRWPLMGVYCATADKKVGNPAAPPDGNNFNWIKGRNYARQQGWHSARYFNDGKDAIDALLAKNVPVVASTRFGKGPNWSMGHCVLLLSRTPADPGSHREGFYVVDDPAGYVVQTASGGYGHYGPNQCGEHVIYPESLVAQALLYPDGITPRYALVLNPAPGTDPDVLMVIGRFDGPGPPPYQLWLQDTSGRQAGWLPGGAPVTDIPDSDAAIAPVVASDPSAVPEVPPDPGRWPYAVSVTQPEDGLTVFVAGNLQADFSLEALRFTAGGVIRSVTGGTVAAGETQQVTLAAPAMYQLTPSAGPGGTVAVSPAPGPYPDGTEVTVTATPEPGYVLSGWTVDGAAGDAAQPLTLLMDTDHTAGASFTAVTVRSVTISPAIAAVPAGTSAPFLATGTYSDGSTGDLTGSVSWSTSDSAAASISRAGLCSARLPGQVTITAALAGVTATAILTVTATPVLVSITVSPADRSVAAGGSLQLTAAGTWSDGSTQDLTGTAVWSSDAATVTVGLTGIVTAGQQPGSSATITAALGTISGSTTVNVVAPPVLTAIEVIPFGAGTQQFRAIGSYSDGSTGDITGSVTWTSSNDQIATITGAGLVAGVAAGPVTIGAAAAGISGSGGLQVGPPALLAIIVSPGRATITAGAAVQLTATGVMSDGITRDLTGAVAWTSQNYLTATVGDTGIAHGGSQPGSTVIAATLAAVSGSADLTVTAAPALEAIAVTPARPVIAAGTTIAFRATGVYADGSTQDVTPAATWSSGTAAVATIEGPGLAAGATGGITQITAAAQGFTGAASLVVTAVPVLRSIAVTPAAPSVPVGETVQFTATGTYTDGSTQDITGTVAWASAEPGIAAVSRAGLATPAAQGTTSITAADGAVSGAASLTVPPLVTAVTWTGQVSDSWQDAGNWSGGQVPGPSHDVVIDGPAGTVVTYAEATSAVHSLNCRNDLSLEGGSLTLGASSVIAGALTMAGAAQLGYGADVLVSGLFTGTYGQLSGPGTITAAGGLTLSGESLLISGGTLVNAGTATWSSGNIGLEQDAAIVNGPGAVFDVQVDRAMTYQGTQVAVFTNNGTFRKSAGPGTASLLAITFDNAGTVELDSGTLSFEPDYPLPGSLATWTGTVTGADGTTLILTGPLVLQEGSSLSVPSVVFNGGPVTIAGQYQASVSTSTTTGSPSVSFTGSARVDITGAVTIDSGTINFGTGTAVSLPSLTLSTGGELAGSDDVLVSGMFTVTSGVLGGPGTVTASGGLAISATGAQLQVSGGTLVNTGYAAWTGGIIGFGPGGAIENRADARFEVPIDQFGQVHASMVNMAGNLPAVFSNAGTFHVSTAGGTGTVDVQSVALDNTGVIQVDGGTLFLQPFQRRAIWTGAFTGGLGSTLVLAGPHELQPGSSLSGPAVQFASPFGPIIISGRYDITGSTSTTTESPAVYFTAGAALISTGAVSIDSGTISFSTGTAVVLPSLTLAIGGELAGTDDVTVSGPFTSTGGQLSGPGTVTADGGLSISGNEEFLISGCTLVNTGAASWSGGAINADNGAVLSNTATGTFDVSCDGLFYWCGRGQDGCNPVGSQPVFENAGTFVKSAGPGVTDFTGFPDLGGMDVSFVNTGTVEVRTGQVAFGRTYTQSAGSLLLTGGSISAIGTLDIQGGGLSGTGTVTANVRNAGALGMGTGVGTLTIAGDYTQLPTGQLTIRLGGVSAGTQYDQLVMSGTAVLAGTLALVLVDGFTPARGAVFTVMTYGAQTGSLAIAGGGQSCTASYAATDLTITAGGPPA